LRIAYLDSSCLVAIALEEADHQGVAAWLYGFDRLYSSNLLEAELRSAMARERVETPADGLLSAITWVFPARPLTPEYELVLSRGYLGGADVWHLACALYLKEELEEVSFLSLDENQTAVARSMGFALE
jgi:predicted nucleic acid-binding protein